MCRLFLWGLRRKFAAVEGEWEDKLTRDVNRYCAVLVTLLGNMHSTPEERRG